MKLSEHGSKQSDPGILQVRRLRRADGRCVADVIYDEPAGLPEPPALVPLGAQEARPAPKHAQQADLLVPVFRGGRAVYEPPPAAELAIAWPLNWRRSTVPSWRIVPPRAIS